MTGNYMIDGDSGSSCFSPNHHGCSLCEAEEERFCELCETKLDEDEKGNVCTYCLEFEKAELLAERTENEKE